jgi:hypothetical protein
MVYLEINLKFLRRLAASDTTAEHVVICDAAGFHQRSSSPPTCWPCRSELNPDEKLRDLVKDVMKS